MSNDLKENIEKDVENVVDDVVDDVVKLENNKIKKRLDYFLNKNKSETIKYYLTYTGLGFGVGIVTSVILARYFYNKV